MRPTLRGVILPYEVKLLHCGAYEEDSSFVVALSELVQFFNRPAEKERETRSSTNANSNTNKIIYIYIYIYM